MHLFLRLLLAHLTADFLLQAGPVYTAKKEGFPGGVLHYLIVFFSFLLFSLPYLSFFGCWVVIVIATLGHIALDEIKVMAITCQKNELIVFAADQLLHVAFLLPVFLFGFSYSVPALAGIVGKVYNSSLLLVFACGYIASTMVGLHIWEAIKNSYLWGTEINSASQKYGLMERALITTAFLNAYLLALLLIPLFVRALSKKTKFAPDFIFNLSFSTLIGLLLRQVL